MAPSSSTFASPTSPTGARDDNQATIASFSPAQSISSYQRRSVQVHQNTPLLIATPPQVTRALAFSHPFLLPLNKFIGLISWSSGDPWESFLLVASFWAVVLFGNPIVKWAGPLLAVAGLMAGMYGRRYSPLSTRGADENVAKGHRHTVSEGGMRHQKSLDEIVDTLNVFTARCNLMLNPLLELTDFLSTQQTATSASTRPALTSLFIRLLMTLPLWVALTLPPWKIITTQRVALIVGTIFLTWHSRPARISRTILWRNLSVRYIVSILTGLEFASNTGDSSTVASFVGRRMSQQATASSVASGKKNRTKGTVRFTFAVYENQRRWLGIGWTSSMFAYERAAWTDEHLNASPPKDRFQLPRVEGGAKWRWAPGSEWRTERDGGVQAGEKGKGSSGGWTYYDNKWNGPRRQDGWNRYTRRRKWYRDAELVDLDSEADVGPEEPLSPQRSRADTAGSARSFGTASTTSTGGPTELPASEPSDSAISPNHLKKVSTGQMLSPTSASVTASGTDASTGGTAAGAAERRNGEGSEDAAMQSSVSSTGTARRRGLFHRRSRSHDNRTETASATTSDSRNPEPRNDDEADRRSVEEESEWLVGDDVKMNLG